jgi:hypothetical protein
VSKARIVLLIDAENISADHVPAIMARLESKGILTVRRAYADWSQKNAQQWTKALAKHAIVTQQQFNICDGKNASDFAMMIDAMDLLHSGTVDIFALASSDSDFGPLVVRLRQSGASVLGFGEAKAPTKFQAMFDQFHVVGPAKPVEPPSKPAVPAASKPKAKRVWQPDEVERFKKAFAACTMNEDKSVSLIDLNKQLIGFKVRKGVFASRVTMLDASDVFEWVKNSDKKKSASESFVMVEWGTG